MHRVGAIAAARRPGMRDERRLRSRSQERDGESESRPAKAVHTSARAREPVQSFAQLIPRDERMSERLGILRDEKAAAHEPRPDRPPAVHEKQRNGNRGAGRQTAAALRWPSRWASRGGQHGNGKRDDGCGDQPTFVAREACSRQCRAAPRSAIRRARSSHRAVRAIASMTVPKSSGSVIGVLCRYSTFGLSRQQRRRRDRPARRSRRAADCIRHGPTGYRHADHGHAR